LVILLISSFEPLEIIAKAHGGRGLSQEGAVDLAEQGYEYQQILAVYYPGAEVARLEVKR
jgi:SpoIID/LytB domain protein